MTLLTLGVYVVVSLLRHGCDFRLHSRWMLVFAAVRRARRWTKARRVNRRDVVVITHEHDHEHGDMPDHGHHHGAVSVGGSPIATRTRSTSHRHLHHHVGTVPDDPFPAYGRRTAFAVGTLHGIGAETPTQVLVFLAATRAGGAASGVLLLICFVAGLLVSNTTITLAAVLGLLSAARNFRVYRPSRLSLRPSASSSGRSSSWAGPRYSPRSVPAVARSGK